MAKDEEQTEDTRADEASETASAASADEEEFVPVSKIAGLKSALQKERQARRAFEKTLKASGFERDEDGEWYLPERDSDQEQEPAPRPPAVDEEAIEKRMSELKKKLAKEHEKKLRGIEDERERMRARLKSVVVDDRLRAALHKAGVIPEAEELVLKYARDFVRMEERGDDWVPRVYDEHGDPQISLTTDDVDMTLDEYAVTLRKRYPQTFRASGTTGSGAPLGTTAGGPAPAKKWSQMSNEEKAAYAKEHGQDKAMALIEKEYSAVA